MSLNEYIAKQFANPHGIGGRIVMTVMNRQNAAIYDATEALLHPKAQDVVLDIGCGNGVMMERIARTCDCRLIGTDISEDVLAIAKRRLDGKNAELLCCPVDVMPIENSAIDKALTINTFYFWNDLADGLQEIARVLKPGGIFISTHYTNRSLEAYSHTQFGYKMHSEGEVVSAVQGTGFDVEKIPIMGDKAYSLVCMKR